MTDPTKDEKNELQIIFSEETVKVGDKVYVVKPWTLRQLILVWPLLTQIFEKLPKREGADQDFVSIILDNPQEVVSLLLPHVDSIISITHNIPKEEVGEMDIGAVTVLLLKIVNKNLGHLKNYFAHAMTETMSLARLTTSTM